MASTQMSNREVGQIITSMCDKGTLKYRVASKSWTYLGQPISPSSLTRILAHNLETAVVRVQGALDCEGFNRQQVAYDYLGKWQRISDGKPRCERALRYWLTLMEREDSSTETKEANVVAMKQSMWAIKRTVAQKSVRWPVAPIFWSRENGTGKSTNVLRLLKPLSSFIKHVPATELGERFSGAMFSNTIIAFIDEFAGVDRVCTAGFKALLGGKPIDQRAIHSEQGIYSEQHLSVIATSNERPPHGFVDYSGARRFWSIHCSGAPMVAGSERAAALDRVDIQDVWAAIGADDPCPHEAAPQGIRAYMDTVREEHLRTRTSLENFVDEGTERCDESVRLPMKEFYTAYIRYCTDSKQRAIGGSHKKLGELLKNLGQVVVSPGNRTYIRGMAIVSSEIL